MTRSVVAPAARPRGPWVMKQVWNNLLFAHWPLPLDTLRQHVPAQLPVDTYEGEGWIGITPFLLSGLRGHWIPPLPFISTFPEINFRTYVTLGSKPGVFFFSLDAASAVAVWSARKTYHLPYFHAEMRIQRKGRLIEYFSRRKTCQASSCTFQAEYEAVGDEFQSEPGSLVQWLTERYSLYTVDSAGQVYRAEIFHSPWLLSAAEASIHLNTLADAAGLTLPPRKPLLHFSRTQNVLVWPLREVESTAL
jgi:uncharacterized protein YqjF (DUF2071 family)